MPSFITSPLSLYPVLPGLAFNVKWSPRFFNQSQKTNTGASIDIALAQYPLIDFELSYEFLRTPPTVSAIDEFSDLLQFFSSMSGSLGRFNFDSPDDDTVVDLPLGLGDGVRTTFELLTKFGWQVGYLQFIPAAIKVGSTPTTAYTLTQANGSTQVVFSSPPGAGSPVTGSYSYFYYCKFTEDTTLFEKFLNGYWLNSSVKFQSCRPGA